MFRNSLLTLTALTGLGIALSGGPARGQGADKASFTKLELPTTTRTAVTALKTGEAPFVKAAARKVLDEMMQYYVEKLTHPYMFSQAQDFRAAADLEFDKLVTQFQYFVIVPEVSKTYTVEQSEYLAEFGDAFVTAFKPVIEGNPERIVRMNVTRLLGVAAKSGAPAFGTYLTTLLGNANTAPEIKFYGFKAAEGLLAAHPASGTKGPAHSLKPADLAALLKAIESNIFNPTQVMSFPPGVDPKQPPPELAAVVVYLRREAIRAYAQVRLPEVKANGQVVALPAYTLARVAMSDPALTPAATPAEVAEAVIGLCGMDAGEAMMFDAAADVVGTGVITFAKLRNASPTDKSIPWKLYAARLGSAVTAWKATLKNVAPNRAPQDGNEVADKAVGDVLAPIEGTGSKRTINLEALERTLTALRNKPTRSKTLFRNDPTTAIDKFGAGR